MKTPSVTTKLSEEFAGRIRSGQWGHGRAIPTEMELMQECKASRNSIRAALKHLEGRGWLKAVQGSGRKVTYKEQTRGAMIGMFARGGEFGIGQASQYLAAIDAAIAELGHTLVLFAINNRQHTLVAEGPWAGTEVSQLDAAIVFARQYELEDIERLAQRMPVVAVTHDATSIDVPSFFVDFAAHAATAVRSLTERDHRHLVLVLPEDAPKRRLAADIRRGFDLGRQFCGLDVDGSSVVKFSLRGRRSGELGALVRQQTPQATAVISYADDVLIDLAQHPAPGQTLREMVCLADLSTVHARLPEAAYFASPLDRLGRDAVTCLNAMLDGQRPAEVYHPYYGELVGLNAAVASA